MKKYILIFLLLFMGMHKLAHAQSMQSAIRGEALKMAKAMAALDFKTYATYMHPSLVKEKGGVEKVKQGLDSVEKYKKLMNAKLSSILIGEVGKIINFNKTLQALVPQSLTVELFGTKLTTETTLVAISEDAGKKWYFIEGNIYSNKTKNIKLPALSPLLVIPPMKKPNLDGMKMPQ